jgi:molecular chaperone GrpE
MSEQPRDPKQNESEDTTPQSAPSQAEFDKLKNDFLYLGAEFENYKRHAIKERSDMAGG